MPDSASPQKKQENKSSKAFGFGNQERAEVDQQYVRGWDNEALQRAQAAPKTLTPANISFLQRTIGNQAVVQLLRESNSLPKGNVQRIPSALIQRSLTVGPADDQYEREADEVARKVVQRASMDDDDDDLMMARDEQVQRVVGPEGGAVGGDIESQIKSSKGGGQPLASSVRSKVEPVLDADLSPIRVHTGEQSVQMNNELGAKAFTTGKDIFVGANGSANDTSLMAHEATHSIQQQAISQGTLQTTRRDKQSPEED